MKNSTKVLEFENGKIIFMADYLSGKFCGHLTLREMLARDPMFKKAGCFGLTFRERFATSEEIADEIKRLNYINSQFNDLMYEIYNESYICPNTGMRMDFEGNII
ncbi:MAG: hypothetical protein HC819_14780 [Cyclobacteriaceae bacterium]|nr:hypothetical protein [Cyclobacteriaceae bacterium]